MQRLTRRGWLSPVRLFPIVENREEPSELKVFLFTRSLFFSLYVTISIRKIKEIAR